MNTIRITCFFALIALFLWMIFVPSLASDSNANENGIKLKGIFSSDILSEYMKLLFGENIQDGPTYDNGFRQDYYDGENSDSNANENKEEIKDISSFYIFSSKTFEYQALLFPGSIFIHSTYDNGNDFRQNYEEENSDSNDEPDNRQDKEKIGNICSSHLPYYRDEQEAFQQAPFCRGILHSPLSLRNEKIIIKEEEEGKNLEFSNSKLPLYGRYDAVVRIAEWLWEKSTPEYSSQDDKNGEEYRRFLFSMLKDAFPDLSRENSIDFESCLTKFKKPSYTVYHTPDSKLQKVIRDASLTKLRNWPQKTIVSFWGDYLRVCQGYPCDYEKLFRFDRSCVEPWVFRRWWIRISDYLEEIFE